MRCHGIGRPAFPFLDHTFDSVFNFGMFRHLLNEKISETVREMTRVVCPGGWVIIFDGVMSSSFWRNPPFWLLRKLDHGRYMRKQEEREGLLLSRESWRVKQFCCSLWGNEGVLCAYRKTKNYETS